MDRLRNYWKALGGALGGLAATHVDWITNNIFQVDFNGKLDASIAVVVAALAVLVFPKNKPREPVVSAPNPVD